MDDDIREEWLIGVRLRDTASADDYKLVGGDALSVGAIVMVETATGTALGILIAFLAWRLWPNPRGTVDLASQPNMGGARS